MVHFADGVPVWNMTNSIFSKHRAMVPTGAAVSLRALREFSPYDGSPGRPGIAGLRVRLVLDNTTPGRRKPGHDDICTSPKVYTKGSTECRRTARDTITAQLPAPV